MELRRGNFQSASNRSTEPIPEVKSAQHQARRQIHGRVAASQCSLNLEISVTFPLGQVTMGLSAPGWYCAVGNLICSKAVTM